MISDLRYAVTFPTNGISLSGQLSLQPGATAITGDNGAGKSFVAEMIRYGLFGKKALRGPASDYKTLDMSLTFRIGDKTYEVSRAKKEELVCEDETLAVGADAVNKKIVETLGFDLEVFDVVCAANQKESERLTRLTPARRKELIDDVVGLTAQEAVEKACKEEARGLQREAEALMRMLVLPEKPEKPTGYRPSAKIRDELHATRDLVAQREKLQRIIDSVGDAPVEPEKECPNLEEIEEHERKRIETDARYKALYSSIERIPDATHSRKELEAAAEVLAYDEEVKRRGPKPSGDFNEEHLVVALGMWAKHHALEEIGDIEVSCPNCGAEFQPGHSSIPPSMSEQELHEELSRVRAWAKPLKEPKGKRLTQAEIVAGTKALDRAEEKKAMQAELDRMPELADRSAELVEARELDKAWDRYVHASEQHMARVAAAKEAEVNLFDLPSPKRSVDELNAAFTAARVYEERLTDYDIAKGRFDELTSEIKDKQERSEAFAAGAKGLVEARRTLKAFLAPSLSRVASHLIRQMTVNSPKPLSSIEVDEDMSITADGQDVSTFNGAHATMINLALRLALGQVLVSRVFPVFIGDEIDSDCDPQNAQAIADALRACNEQLKQIIVISHKRLEDMDEEIML